MLIEVKVPAVGESITEGLLVEWLKQDGEAVQGDDHLFVLETDKVTMTVDSPGAGRLKILISAGEPVKVGQAVGVVDTEAPGEVRAESAGLARPPVAVPQTPGPPVHPPAGPLQAEAKAAAMLAGGELSPAVRRMVGEFALDPSSIKASGKDGRITKEDVVLHLKEKAGQAGRVAFQERAAKQAPPAISSATSSAAPPAAAGERTGLASPRTERQTRTPLSPIRQRIAERMLLSQQGTATLTTFAEADMSAVVAIRNQFKERFKAKHGVSLGFMSFFVKAVVDALEAVPALMSSIDGGDLVQNHAFDIGIAVSTERGLVVPVLRDADAMSFADVEKGIAELARRARERTITLAELEGGVFTVTNAGSYGALFGTPILNPPQSGILGTYAIKEQVVAVGSRVEIRPMMILALSYDHRAVDGEAAGKFLQRATAALEHPAVLLLGI